MSSLPGITWPPLPEWWLPLWIAVAGACVRVLAGVLRTRRR